MYVYKCRVELQDPKRNVLENNSVPTAVKFSEFSESHEPTYEVVGGTQMVKISPNPAYGTTVRDGKQDVKIIPNPAYGTTSFTVKSTEDPAYI